MSLSDYFLLMVEFCYRFWVRHRWQQPEGIPGGFGVEKPSEAPFTALMWANVYHKDLTVFWHVIGCRNLWLPVWGPSARPWRK